MTSTTYHINQPNVPETVYCIYQMMFAIITAALICGSFADRMKYSSLLVFISLWHIFGKTQILILIHFDFFNAFPTSILPHSSLDMASEWFLV